MQSEKPDPKNESHKPKPHLKKQKRKRSGVATTKIKHKPKKNNVDPLQPANPITKASRMSF